MFVPFTLTSGSCSIGNWDMYGFAMYAYSAAGEFVQRSLQSS